MQHLQTARKNYPDARHHCWAYLIGSPQGPVTVAMSDDGEPSGTAGKPILNIIQHNKAGDLMLIVVRYFGGIKLGAGGLVRAYAQAAQKAYDCADFKQHCPAFIRILECNFDQEQVFRHWLTKNKGRVRNARYSDRVSMEVELDARLIDELEAYCAAHIGAQLSKDQNSHL